MLGFEFVYRINGILKILQLLGESLSLLVIILEVRLFHKAAKFLDPLKLVADPEA